MLCLHGLGGTKASFLPTVGCLADSYRVVALDLPGFGELDKPIGAPCQRGLVCPGGRRGAGCPRCGARASGGNSMGGRVAIEAGLTQGDRVDGLALLSPALAWLRDRRWLRLARLAAPNWGSCKSRPGRSSRRSSAACFPPWTTGWRWGWTSSCAPLDSARMAAFGARHAVRPTWTSRTATMVSGRGRRSSPPTRCSSGAAAGTRWCRSRSCGTWSGCCRLPATWSSTVGTPQLEQPRATHAAIRDFLRER